MTNQSDSFIDEVTEELRRDKLFRSLRRYGWLGIGLVVVIVGGTAWREYNQHQARQSAQDFGDALIAAQEVDDPHAALMAMPADGLTSGQELVRSLLASSLLVSQDKQAEAAKLLRESAEAAKPAKAGGASLLREMALLKAVMEDPAMDLAARDAVLTKLSEPGAPFRLLALEQKAIALIGAGRDADAAVLLNKIQEEEGLGEAMASRLAATLIALGDENAGRLPDGSTLPDPAESN